MKKIMISTCLLLISVLAIAQKQSPKIENGTKISYMAYVSNQQIPVQMVINKSNGTFALAWQVDGYGMGSFEMSEKAVENGSNLHVSSQPSLGVTKLNDDETYGIISKKAFRSLVTTKEFEYNKIKFKQSETSSSFKLNGKEIDAIFVTGVDNPIEFWILNNADYPLILKIFDNVLDLVVVDIE